MNMLVNIVNTITLPRISLIFMEYLQVKVILMHAYNKKNEKSTNNTHAYLCHCIQHTCIIFLMMAEEQHVLNPSPYQGFL